VLWPRLSFAFLSFYLSLSFLQLHTNYGAYIQQYSMGTSFVTAAALNALSALTVRAYCHRVIRLSGTLTSFESSIETTSNVHGVQPRFLGEPVQTENNQSNEGCAPVYFIGKVVWAKGFDKILELQELYKDSTGKYFPIDVYGTGNDLKSIKRTFFGRKGSSSDDDTSSEDCLSPSTSSENLKAKGESVKAKEVFDSRSSLRTQVEASASKEERGDDDETESSNESVEKRRRKRDFVKDIIGDISNKTISTATETGSAAFKLIESVMEAGLGAFTSCKDDTKDKSLSDSERDTEEQKTTHVHKHKNQTRFFFRPRFKWRREPLPARFLGVLDHAQVRDIPQHKIFLNMSTTEVLCTTSAEALAMGKFVVLPKHRK
jgi:hypothetical protein